VLYRIGNGLYLGGRSALTNDKKISYCFMNFSKIKGHYTLSFFVLDRLYNGFEDFGIFC